jgi:hypothetical protein
MSDRKVRFAPDSEVFSASSVAFTPQVSRDQLHYKPPSDRTPEVVAPPSTLHRPNYEDILRRVSVVLHQHIEVCETRLKLATPETMESGLFRMSSLSAFSEDNFVTPQYVCHFVRSCPSRLGICYGIKKIKNIYVTPTVNEIYTFLRTLFVEAQLSPECSIVCLIYVERLMEVANVPLTATTWRPCVICGLLLASKVWQDLR